MSTITFRKNDSKWFDQNTISINGRKQTANRITSITKVGSGKWTGMADGFAFTIFGGKAAGGSRSEWFVQWTAEGDHPFIKCNSAKAAIKHIEHM